MEPTIDAMGSRLAYVVSGPDARSDRVRYHLWLHELDTGKVTLAESVEDIRTPRFSADGSRLVCLVGNSVGVVDDAGGVVKLAGPDGPVTQVAVSPDGRLVVVGAAGGAKPRAAIEEITTFEDMRHPIEGEIWLLATDGSVSRKLSVRGLAQIANVTVSPDGTRIALCARRRSGDAPASSSSLFVVDIATEELQELVPSLGPIKGLSWSPDGRQIAYIGHTHAASHGANLELHTVALNGTAPRSLSFALDRSVGQAVRGDDERAAGPADVVWTARGILALCAFGASSALLRFSPDGEHATVIGGRRAIVGFDAARESQAIAFVWSDPETPGELSICTADGSDERRLSDVNGAWRRDVVLAETEHVVVTASDGVAIDSFLTTPVGSHDQPCPLVLQVHGGPHYPIGHRFSFDAQRLAAAGFAVARANPRGAQGYGADFASEIGGAWGERDFADLLEVVEVMATRPDIDAARIAIVGESYGGFMVNWALSHSKRFVAGIAENGISNMAGLAVGLREVDFWRDELGAPGWASADALVAGSPLFSASEIEAPLQLIHAEDDTTVPIEQSEMLYVALKSLDRDVRFHRIPDEQHWVNVFGAPSRRLARIEVFDRFLSEQLLDRGAENGNGDQL
jgi:dipeptidyl aminopeptidase/acylaminoacyl peptidase